MRKQRVSSSSGAVSLCKLLLMVIALICTLHTASVEGETSQTEKQQKDAPLLLVVTASAAPVDAAAPSLPIGVNYGANADNLPSTMAVASFLATRTTINHVKLFDANLAFISAFANTPISLIVSLPNSVLPVAMAQAARHTTRWVFGG
ncbi:hypothetical protein ABZP36_031232 [Zizania latifolia]